MANQHLLGTSFEIPEEVMKSLQAISNQYGSQSGVNGVKRLKGLISRRVCTYEQLKRIKNYFDHYNPKTDPDGVEFNLNGGQMMKDWVNWQLETARQSIYQGNKVQNDTAMVNGDDVAAPDVNAEKKNTRTPMDVPDLMSTTDLDGKLFEQVNKMKNLINKL